MSTPFNHESMVERLVADARPTRPLWSPAARLTLWLALEVATVATAVAFGLRETLAPKLRDPAFLLQLTLLMAGGGVAAHVALRAAVPGAEVARRVRIVGLLLVLAGLAGVLVEPAHAAPSLARFLASGAQCVASVVGFAALPGVALLWAQRRGAPLDGRIAAAYAGAAASVFGVVAVRLACPIDDRLHLALWHTLPIAIGTGLSAVVGARWVTGWTHAATPARTR